MTQNELTTLVIFLYTLFSGMSVGFAVDNPTPTQIGLSVWVVLQSIIFSARRLIKEAQNA